MICMHAGYQLRALLVHETFKKVLYIAPSARGEFSSGRVFNLVMSDAETLQLLCQNIMGLISSPLRILVAMLMLYFELGVSSIVALCVLLLLMPTQVSKSALPVPLLQILGRSEAGWTSPLLDGDAACKHKTASTKMQAQNCPIATLAFEERLF